MEAWLLEASFSWWSIDDSVLDFCFLNYHSRTNFCLTLPVTERAILHTPPFFLKKKKGLQPSENKFQSRFPFPLFQKAFSHSIVRETNIPLGLRKKKHYSYSLCHSQCFSLSPTPGNQYPETYTNNSACCFLF